MPKQRRKRPITSVLPSPILPTHDRAALGGPNSDLSGVPRVAKCDGSKVIPSGSSHRSTQNTIATYHTLLRRRTRLLSLLSPSPSASSSFSPASAPNLTPTTSTAQTELKEIDSQLVALGGLQAYQAASTLGQDVGRGGDSSKVLVGWLKELGEGWRDDMYGKRRKLRMLEIGALSPTNAASLLPFVENHPIDLESRHPEIVRQDFLQRRVPGGGAGSVQGKGKGKGKEDLRSGRETRGSVIEQDEAIGTKITDVDTVETGDRSDDDDGQDDEDNSGNAEKFDIVSCSLVLNFVPDPGDRGKMLRLIHAQLRPSTPTTASYLFLVLPSPCLTNSRYLTPSHFLALMTFIGFEPVEERMKPGGKVGYSLWRWREEPTGREREKLRRVGEFDRKRVINEGKKRNNFVILLRD